MPTRYRMADAYLTNGVVKQFGRGTLAWTGNPLYSAVAAAAAASANAVGVRVVIPKSGTITSIAYYVGTASGNVDLGIYSISGTSRTKVSTTGSTAAAGTNTWQVLSLSASATVAAGDEYDFCFSADNSTVTYGRVGTASGGYGSLPSGFDTGNAAGSDVLAWVKSASFPLPASFSSVVAAASTNTGPLIIAKIV